MAIVYYEFNMINELDRILTESIEREQRINEMIYADRALTAFIRFSLSEFNTKERIENYLNNNGSINTVSQLYDLNDRFIYGGEDLNQKFDDYAENYEYSRSNRESQSRSKFVSFLRNIWYRIKMFIQRLIPIFGHDIETLKTNYMALETVLREIIEQKTQKGLPINFPSTINPYTQKARTYKVINFNKVIPWANNLHDFLRKHADKIDASVEKELDHLKAPTEKLPATSFSLEVVYRALVAVYNCIYASYLLHQFLKDRMAEVDDALSKLNTTNETVLKQKNKELMMIKDNASTALRILKKLNQTFSNISNDIVTCAKIMH